MLVNFIVRRLIAVDSCLNRLFSSIIIFVIFKTLVVCIICTSAIDYVILTSSIEGDFRKHHMKAQATLRLAILTPSVQAFFNLLLFIC